ncbi:hypothetical protein V7O62_02045 [Methanolobus sp. ZRKC2]|uniref:hypothetical protein n=1 Tax=Methanolobus sp. ZRKC2 TaxID=3125783 RepID=UPI00324DE687
MIGNVGVDLVEINDYLKHLEWDKLQNEIQMDKVHGNPNLPQNIQKIVVSRDDSYKLRAKLFYIEKRDSDKSWMRESVPGSQIDTFTIVGETNSGIKVELYNCFIDQWSSNWSATSNESNSELDISVYKIKVNYSNDSEAIWLADWYLNGSDIYLPRFTHRDTTLNYNRSRGVLKELRTKYENKYLGVAGADFAFINAGDIKFLITQVDKEFSPQWSHSFSIEYRKEFDFIPTFDQRNAISEIVSFVIGKQLISVGSTCYNQDGYLTKVSAVSPFKNNILSLCRKPSREPIAIGPSNAREIETILNELIPSYLNLRTELNLDLALNIYWASLEAPLGTNLPILASALEIIMKGWFKTTKSKSKGLYMKKREFDKLLKDDLENIFNKLKDKDNGTPIFNKINNSYNMSVTNRFQQFFDEIELKVGDIENSALKSRHKMAHGDLGDNDEIYNEMLNETFAYESLFNRVFLKILGYNGYYIDKSTLNFPSRHINTQLGGDKGKT